MVDDLGHQVVLSAPARTVVSLAPHLTEMMFSLGAGDRVVATVRHSDFPAEAARIPQLGDAFSLSLEAVVEISPDLILAWSTGGNRRTVERLKSLGLAVYLNEASSLEEIATNLERIGILVGEEATGAGLAAEFRETLGSLDHARSEPTPDVFFQISDTQLYSVNNAHLIGQALSACGARNVFGDLAIPVPMVSLESVVEAQPDYIVVASPFEGFATRWADEWQRLGWSDRIRYIDASLITRPGFRMLKGIKSLCNLLHD